MPKLNAAVGIATRFFCLPDRRVTNLCAHSIPRRDAPGLCMNLVPPITEEAGWDCTHGSSRATKSTGAGPRAITPRVTASVDVRFHAGIGAGCVSSLENGLNVKAIRKAPSPMIHEPI